MRIALLGFGLIGGSIARALRERGLLDAGIELVAWSPSGEGPASAARDGVIDSAASTPPAALDGADLVVLAGPAPTVLEALETLAGAWRTALASDAVITDVASTKSAIVARASTLGLRFVGGHPMAGLETSGYAAAEPGLFVDRPWVVVPGSVDEPAIERVETLARAVGARPMRMDAADHDAAVAGVSHLPLILAASLVEAVAGRPGSDRDGWPVAAGLAATGWRGMTRLAKGDVEMGAGILSTNAGPIADRIRDLVAVLEGWLTELDGDGGPDTEAIASRLQAARDRLGGTPG
ncbi:MAG TPA: prephenate dehydrogenase/arogenate dehydrogenase family protein [Candidatus Limnocylindrales bacterium]|nr:prephenate dehydrogenase/arogenate dehydrogenase family protein [Candidatus Limnocylindrales bacterium]